MALETLERRFCQDLLLGLVRVELLNEEFERY